MEKPFSNVIFLMYNNPKFLFNYTLYYKFFFYVFIVHLFFNCLTLLINLFIKNSLK